MPSSSAREKCWSRASGSVDTLLLARRKYPGAPNRLDDLCARYGIDNSRRTKHGALLDAEILAEVYLELIGARQAQLILVEAGSSLTGAHAGTAPIRVRPNALAPRLTADEREAHLAFVATLGENAIWREYLDLPGPSANVEARAASLDRGRADIASRSIRLAWWAKRVTSDR